MAGSTGQNSAVARLAAVKARIEAASGHAGRSSGSVCLVAVSKTFNADAIRPVIEAGQRIFGENRVQEAMAKWPGLRAVSPAPIELHLLGPLQSNKAAEAVATFDVIESVDRPKIARVLAEEMHKQNRLLPCYVQVNVGREPQKAGVPPEEAVAFVAACRGEHGLKVEGLMCIPPVDTDPEPHFRTLVALADEAGLPFRSMGMSADYETAIACGSTHVRVGSAIFGARD